MVQARMLAMIEKVCMVESFEFGVLGVWVLGLRERGFESEY